MLNIEDLILWQKQPETRQILMEINKEINQQSKYISDGLLLSNPNLTQEYCSKVGYIRGLKFAIKLLQHKEE